MVNDAQQAGDFDLSVIVPVHNAERHLEKLAGTVFGLGRKGLRCQMICVDDASSDASPAILRDLAATHPDLIAILGDDNRGAGIARNEGWPLASGRYALFFDADDILHGEVLADAIRDMDAAPDIDLAMFAYRYEREETASFTDMNYDDRKILDLLLKGQAVETGRIEDMARLLTFTNYPWNKLLRTAHYRDRGMRFGRTRVNNDILGHWHGLLLARAIMLRDAVLCTHVVHPAGTNLTNAFGAERLAMFEALEETYDFLEARPVLRRRFAHHFWALCDRLAGWARPRLDPALRIDFEARYAALLGRLDLGDLARMRTRHSPRLAGSLVNHLIR